MKNIKIEIIGEKKEHMIAVPENFSEAVQRWGREKVYQLAVRAYLTDEKISYRLRNIKEYDPEKERHRIQSLINRIRANKSLLKNLPDDIRGLFLGGDKKMSKIEKLRR